MNYWYLLLDADCEQNILWLQNNDKPWIKVTQLWEKTSKNRLKSLKSDDQSIQDYIKLYSALTEPQGYILVRINKNNYLIILLIR